METTKQKELEFDDPFDTEIYQGYIVNDNIQLITAPKFHWIIGEWRALANVNGALCIISLKITKNKPNSKS